MSEWIDCTLDVLATNPKEINDIAKALQEPSRDLLVRFTTTWPPDEAEMGDLREFAGFKAISNLGYIAESVNKARRFQNSFKNHSEAPIYMHLSLVSAAFPNAIFLAHYSNFGWGYSWREVIRNGVVERSVSDSDQPAQAIEWVLPDIFAPFRTEYQNGQPFGSMWNKWVDDLASAANGLGSREMESKNDDECGSSARSDQSAH